ncbi:hypothetical protein GQ43DRAFT_440127, partial [Delitschia confertaspora ATCC 74209]
MRTQRAIVLAVSIFGLEEDIHSLIFQYNTISKDYALRHHVMTGVCRARSYTCTQLAVI